MKSKSAFGKEGEARACIFLERSGYEILQKNYHSPLGEIDVVALDGDVLCFIEVKSRRSLAFGCPEEAVHYRKQKKIIQVALGYLKEKRVRDTEIRFDVVSQYKEECELIKGAFQSRSWGV